MVNLEKIKKITPIIISVFFLACVFFYYDVSVKSFSVFDPGMFLLFVLIALAGAFTGSVRLFANFRKFYKGFSLWTAHRINAFSSLAGLFFAGVIGSTLTKISLPVLSKTNKHLIVMISLVEKAAMVGLLSAIGLISVYQLKTLEFLRIMGYQTRIDWSLMLLIMGLVVFTFLTNYLKQYLKIVSLFLLPTILLSSVIVLINLISPFLIMDRILDVSFSEKILLSTALMFVGSLPISFQGLGAREAAATLLLTPYGIEPNVLVGNVLMLSVSSIVATILLPATTILYHSKEDFFEQEKQHNIEKALDYVGKNIHYLAISAFLFCLYEVRVMILNNQVSVTFGDFFSVFLLLSMAGMFLEKKIDSHMREFVRIFLIVYIYFFGSFLMGFFKFGFIEWAFYNRLIGGLVLLGYAYTGFLLAMFERSMIQRVMKFMLFILSIYLVFYNILHIVRVVGNFQPFASIMYSPRFLGTVSNPNSFAFIMGIMAIIYYLLYRWGHLTNKIYLLSQGVFFSCVILTQSRAGIITYLFFLFWSILFPKDKKYRKIYIIIIMISLTFSALMLSVIRENIGGQLLQKNFKNDAIVLSAEDEKPKPSEYNISSNDNVRFETTKQAWTLFKENPIFGTGLGGSFEKSKTMLSEPKIIHSSVLLYLADTGAVGVLLISVLFFWLYSLSGKIDEHSKVFKLVFCCAMGYFGLFSIVHDVSYQRFFWIWIGMMIGLAARSDRNRGLVMGKSF